jgi:hypothetical protein
MNYYSSSINSRDVSQSGIVKEKNFSNFSQFSAENFGRFAGVGNSSDLAGRICFVLIL